MPSNQQVHLIFKTHLDVGFTDYAQTVIARYFEHFIPQALATAQAMREQGQDRFIWTTGSWLIYEALERADPAQRRTLEAALANGDIVWHALPFTTHTELIDPTLFEFGLRLSAELDARFGRTTIAAKMTDVPGHTRSMVPLLAAAGVRFLHIGVNGASHPPDVPPLFVWRAPSGESITVMYQFGGYGDLSLVPGLDAALAFAHTGDNHGPQSVDDARASFAELRERLPNAHVFGSTLDAFAAQLDPIIPELPVITQEIGDTWIHGAGSDPIKVARFRELSRLRNTWLASGQAGEQALQRFSRTLLMVPEHTWGMDEKTHLADYDNYRAADFRAARALPKFRAFEQSWAEQRAYLDHAIAALDNPTLAEQAHQAITDLAPQPLDLAGFVQLDPTEGSWEAAHLKIGFDPNTGAIAHLSDQRNGRIWADAQHMLGLFRYQTFSAADYARFRRMYNVNKRETAIWSIDDYTKPGLERSGAIAAWWLPQLRGVWRRVDAEATCFVAILDLPPEASEQYGCPPEVTIDMRIAHTEAPIELAVQWLTKPACRMPEALWCSFNPIAPDAGGWSMDKQGQQVKPGDVIRHGNRRLHAVGGGVHYRDARGQLELTTLDAPLVAPGEPSLLNFTTRQPPLQHGMHVNLFNNLWGTNFPMWFDEPARFRFKIALG